MSAVAGQCCINRFWKTDFGKADLGKKNVFGKNYFGKTRMFCTFFHISYRARSASIIQHREAEATSCNTA